MHIRMTAEYGRKSRKVEVTVAVIINVIVMETVVLDSVRRGSVSCPS
jgi:hypothetical protein